MVEIHSDATQEKVCTITCTEANLRMVLLGPTKVDVNVKVEETGCTCFFQAGIQRHPIKKFLTRSRTSLPPVLYDARCGAWVRVPHTRAVHSSVNDTIVLADTFRNFFMPADTVKNGRYYHYRYFKIHLFITNIILKKLKI